MSIRFAAILSAAFVIVGCSGSSDNIGPTDPQSGNGNPAPPPTGVGSFKALFVAASGVLPYPTDLYFNGSTDGTLAISSSTLFPQRATMNQLDGFSTTASSYFRMSQPVRNDAAMLNSSVRIIRAPMLRQPSGVYAPVGVLGVLTPGVDYSARVAPEIDVAGAEVEIVWLKPLAASTGVFCSAPLPTTEICGNGYIVLVTTGIENNSNTAATPDSDYLTIRTEAIAEIGRSGGNPAFVPTCPGITNDTLNSICRLTYAQLAIGANPALGPAAINPANVILSYSFTTQSTRDALALMSQSHTSQPITAVPTGLTTTALLAAAGFPANPACPGCADVHAGTLQIPYFLDPDTVDNPATTAFDPPALTRPWIAAGPSAVPGIDATNRDITRFNLVPLKKADLLIPLLAFRPNGNSPSGGVKPLDGWPVVVFMHGLGGDRTNAVPIADTYASQGFVVVAIDQVFHGITSPANPLYAPPPPAVNPLYGAGVRERTFDADFQNNATGAPGPDGNVDGSGRNTLFIAASAPLVTRDGWRQAGSDLITLAKSLGSLDLDGLPGGDIDLSEIHYSGISLGGIVGPACICSEVKSYYLNVPGGPLPEILRTSPSFSGSMNALLAGASALLQPNTALYSQFFREMQAAMDAGDPSNYVKQLATDRPVLFSKVIGDTVVPNPTSNFLINAAGATKITAAGLQPVAAAAPRFVTFLTGSHGSLLSPAASLAVTEEMQTHAASLAATGGTAIQVMDSGLLEQ